MNRRTKYRNGVAMVVLLAVLGMAAPSPAAFLVLTNGKKEEGTSLRLNAQGQYILETAQGVRTYAPSQVARAEADKPAGFDQALALASSNPDKAVEQLTAIARQTRGLGWDAKANLRVAQITSGQGKYEQAVKAFEALPDYMMKSADVRFAYWKALVEAGNSSSLEGQLKAAIAEGDRGVSARAQLLRGDIKQKRRQLEPAALDYLRAAILYADVREVRPEALYKAADTLAELRDSRAGRLFDQLKSDYPDSEWAAKAADR